MQTVVVTCRMDSMHEKSELDGEIYRVLKMFKGFFRGKTSHIDEKNSDMERKYFFGDLAPANANRLKSIATQNRGSLGLKGVEAKKQPVMKKMAITTASTVSTKKPTKVKKSVPPPPPPDPSSAPASSSHDDEERPFLSVASCPASSETFGHGSFGSHRSPITKPSGPKSVSSSFGFGSSLGDGAYPDSGTSHFSDLDPEPPATPEVLLLRELNQIIEIKSTRGTLGKKKQVCEIGEKVVQWAKKPHVKKVLLRIEN